nr:plasmid recombination protein [Dorea sp. D27]
MKRTISVMVGKGSANHNSRKFHAKNTDPERSDLNIEYYNENIREIYHELFDEALARYNNKQKRSDRLIDDYYEKILSSKQEKTFHEIILQIGNKADMGAKTEDGRLAAKILDEYMSGFRERNPTLRVFSAHLHMDEATPHLHIDFVPFTTGSKRGLETRVSLKQALATLGFWGGTRSETEWNQWVAAEKKQLAAVMLQHGIEWEQKGTHEKHLSVLDFEKKERAKEVAELEVKKSELQEENAAFEEINETIQEQLTGIDEEIHSLQSDLEQSRQEAEKAQKQVDKYQKRMNELAPMVKNMERLAAEFSTDPEQALPEVAIMESAKSYREKKAKPIVAKLVQILRSVYSAYLDISSKFEKLQPAYYRERSGNERLTNRLEEVLGENSDLQMAAADLGRVKAVFGSRQVEDAISWAKQQEQPKKETSVRKRLEQAKENVEIRENRKHNKKSKNRDMER